MCPYIYTALFHPFLQSAQALTYDDIQGLTYLEVKGSGVYV